MEQIDKTVLLSNRKIGYLLIFIFRVQTDVIPWRVIQNHYGSSTHMVFFFWLEFQNTYSFTTHVLFFDGFSRIIGYSLLTGFFYHSSTTDK